MDKALALKNEALGLIENGQGESDRMSEILQGFMALIEEGRSVAVVRACLNKVAAAL